MKDERKTKAELIEELAAWRKRAEELEAQAHRGKWADGEQKRHAKTLEALKEMSKALNAASDLKELLDSAAAHLADNPHVVAGGIYLLDESGERLNLEKSFGPHAGLYEERGILPLAEAAVKSIMWSDTGVYVDGLLGGDAWRNLIAEELRAESHIVAAAMRAGPEAVGVLTILLEKADVYTVSFVETVAAELGSAV
jgi:transcriptional regulator with GAF, ATPase, and Fis domain